MSFTTEDMLVNQAQPTNIIARLDALAAMVEQLKNPDPPPAPLSSISSVLGDIDDADIILGNENALGEGFSGLIIAGSQFEWPEGSGQFWNLAGFNTDTLEVGIDALTGKLLAGGGAVELDRYGVNLVNLLGISGINFVDPAIGNAGGNLGGIGQGSGDRAWFEFDTYENEERLQNPGFEAGAFTNWTAAGAGTWSVQTTTVYEGNYAAKCVLSGTGAHTLTSSRMQPSALDVGLMIVFQYDTLVGWTTKKAEIKWYDQLAGGNLLQTDSIDLGNASAGSWLYKILRATGPNTSVSYEVVLTVQTSSGTPTIYFDGLRLRGSPQYNAIEIRGSLQGAVPNGPYMTAAPPSSGLADAALPYWVDSYNMTSPLHFGHHKALNTYSNYAGEVPIYRHMINGGSTGLKGHLFTIVQGWAANLSGSNKTVQIRGRIGGPAGTLVLDTGAITITNGQYFPFVLFLSHVNGGVANAPTFLGWFNGRAFGGGATIGAPTTTGLSLSGNSQDMSADQELVISSTLSAAVSSLSFSLLGAWQIGPYFA